MRRKLNDPEIEKRGDFEPRLPRTMLRLKGDSKGGWEEGYAVSPGAHFVSQSVRVLSS
jgi:hypothetical protein